ncbi:hypothetical protein [Bermanella sp. R86510]|uniref:hypothetical protein n=1 Tax=unclassified Bermanella TaxID=2627862 RepID=UPI0037CA2D3F
MQNQIIVKLNAVHRGPRFHKKTSMRVFAAEEEREGTKKAIPFKYLAPITP